MELLNVLKSQERHSRLAHAYFVEGDLEIEKIASLLKIGKPDLLVIQEIPLKISQVRELIRWLILKPHSSPSKLVIILQAEAMTLEAGNALLKVLEEPPARSILILQSNKSQRILPTILSRCQLVKEKKIPQELSIDEYLDPLTLAQKSIRERFDYAQKISDLKDLSIILNLWEDHFRDKLHQEENVLEILKKISKTKDLLFTNSSVKLLLEDLLLNF